MQLSPWQQVMSGLKANSFWWMTGFEGSNIPQMEADEYEWTQHYQNWEQDLELVAGGLGIKRIRYTLPWYRLNPARGKFEWAWADRVMARMAELGIDVILNPIQFGTPQWLENGFGNPDFPQYAADYFAQLARRYGQQVKFYTPHNEPLIAALFSGDFGHWPPYWKGRENYLRVVNNIAQQIILSVEAVRAYVPEAIMIHVDAGEFYATRQNIPWLLEDVKLRNERRFLFYDLVSGRVKNNHLLLDWLTRYGMTDNELAWFQEKAIELDVVGVDFYPHCEAWLEIQDGHEVQHRDHGYKIVRSFEACGNSRQVQAEVGLPVSLFGMLRQYYERYQRPIMLTETDFCGLHSDKVLYLNYTVQEIKHLRAEGIPVLGYTWWPVLDHLNWNLALHERDHIHPVGLWELRPDASGNLQRSEGAAVAAFRALLADPQTAVGAVKDSLPRPQNFNPNSFALQFG